MKIMITHAKHTRNEDIENCIDMVNRVMVEQDQLDSERQISGYTGIWCGVGLFFVVLAVYGIYLWNLV